MRSHLLLLPRLDMCDREASLSDFYAGYDLAIDYSKEPVPPLLETDVAWADALLQEQGLR
jgi:hypothetical protein